MNYLPGNVNPAEYHSNNFESHKSHCETSMFLPTPKTGLAAFEAELKNLDFINGPRLWFGVGQNKFYQGVKDENGEIILYDTEKENDDPKSRKITNRLGEAYTVLRAASEKYPDGIFKFPGHPQETPTTDTIHEVINMVVELDWGDEASQKARIQLFCDITGLYPVTVVRSGGKSLHLTFKFVCPIAPDQNYFYIWRLLAICLLGDPNTLKVNQKFRLAGFYRFKKGHPEDGKEQDIIFESENRHAPEQFIEGVKRFFDYQGFKFVYELPDNFFNEKIVPILRGGTPQTKDQKLKEVFDYGLNAFKKDKSTKEAIRIAKLSNQYKEEDYTHDQLEFIIKNGLQHYTPRTERGGSTFDRDKSILWSMKNLVGESRAVALMEQHSPSFNSSGKEVWRVSQVVKNPKSTAGLGTFIYCVRECNPNWKVPKFKKVENDPSGKGFEILPEQKPYDQLTKVEKRDWLIQNRETKFKKDFWPHLQKDFTISKLENREITTYEGYAPKFEINKKTIFLRGWLGAGKTEAVLKSLLEEFLKDRVIIWVTGRNGLHRQTECRAEKLGLKVYHYQDDPVLYRMMLRTNQPGIYHFCPDSFKDYHVKEINWHDVIGVIDEFAGIRREVPSKSSIMPEFQRFLTDVAHLICVDAFLGDVDLKFISKYRGVKNRAIYEQAFSKSKKHIHWLEARNKSGEISMSHDGIPYALIEEWVKKDIEFPITTDSKLDAKVCANFITSLGKGSVVCSSETVEQNKTLMADPDKFLKEQGEAKGEFLTLIYTPTAQSGLDVQTHFDKGLAIFTGVISPIDFLQMIGRCRQCDEWYVSAARRSIDPNCAVKSLDSNKIRGWVDSLSKTYEEFEINHPQKTVGVGFWQQLTRDVEKAFGSEYLQCLLEMFFEHVDTVYTVANKAKWDFDVRSIKQAEAKSILTADLEHGLKLIDKQKAPEKDSDVWDMALAVECEKYPNLWKKWIVDHAEAVAEKKTSEAEMIIDMARSFLSRRVEKLKNWVSVTGEHAEEDIESLEKSLKKHFTSYNSDRFKTLRNMKLFQLLDLDALAHRKGEKVAHKTHFRPESPVICDLWTKFQNTPKLYKLFPHIETLFDFWAILKSCMSFFGYESDGGNIRIQTPGELHPNGKDRKGNPRFTDSISMHFMGWYEMEFSGSEFFQLNFSTIVEALEDRLERERISRRAYEEKQMAFEAFQKHISTPKLKTKQLDIGFSPPIAA